MKSSERIIYPGRIILILAIVLLASIALSPHRWNLNVAIPFVTAMMLIGIYLIEKKGL